MQVLRRKIKETIKRMSSKELWQSASDQSRHQTVNRDKIPRGFHARTASLTAIIFAPAKLVSSVSHGMWRDCCMLNWLVREGMVTSSHSDPIRGETREFPKVVRVHTPEAADSKSLLLAALLPLRIGKPG
jgi:hypothetical protein